MQIIDVVSAESCVSLLVVQPNIMTLQQAVGQACYDLLMWIIPRHA